MDKTIKSDYAGHYTANGFLLLELQMLLDEVKLKLYNIWFIKFLFTVF